MEIIQSPSLGTGHASKFASEVKFVVSPSQADEIRKWSRANLQADPHGSGETGDNYTITSIYLDTENFDVLQRNGSFGRGKYRIRRYGDSSEVFLERKMKTRGLVSKKRTQVPLHDLTLVATGEPNREWAGYWYHRRLTARRLHPVCQISYQRTARMLMSPTGPLRLTLDEQVAAVGVNQFAFEQAEPALLSTGGVIVEIKFRQQMPALFSAFIQQFALTPKPASKYRIACATLGLGIPKFLTDADAVEAA